MPEEIVKNQNFSIYRHVPVKIDSQCQDVVVVTFDNIAGGLKPKGFGTEFLLKCGVESFFVSHRGRSFFQDLPDYELKKHIGDYLSDKRVISYGSSLGGYAAIYYSGVLGSKPLAFSPRCSADPLYTDFQRWGVNFKHDFIDEKNLGGALSPVVVIDPHVEKDKLYLDSRIYPAYGGNLNVVEMPHVNHGTAEAMLAQGVLKDFVLSVILRGEVKDICFDPWKNPYSLGEMAFKYARAKNFPLANKCLQSLVGLGAPRGVSRLRSYELLVRYGKLRHKISRKEIFASEVKAAHAVFFNKVKSAKNQKEALLFEFQMHVWLLNYSLASALADQVARFYPSYAKEHRMLELSKKYIDNSKEWVL